MKKTLMLYTYLGEGVQSTPFPDINGEPIEIGAFRYDAKRMGGAPTITASVYYPSCLDDEWTDNVYAEFNDEKYFLKQTPTSSYNNESTMYKHDLELISERVALDNVYFFDVVTGSPQGDDKPVSNSTKVTFFGNIREFVRRLNASLEYSGLKYSVEVDNDSAITTEERLMSFEDQFFSNVLQEIYKTYEVPYYFDGKVIHIGWANSSDVIPTFRYGVNDALLSITKNNANYKIVNRATATGSSDNIPFYYPNNSPKGNIEAVESGQLGIKVLDFDTFANKVDVGGVITYQGENATVTKVLHYDNLIASGSFYAKSKFTYKGYSTKFKMYITSSVKGSVPLTIRPLLDFKKYNDEEDTKGVTASGTTTICIFLEGKLLGKSKVGRGGHTFDLTLPSGSSVLEINLHYAPDYDSSLNWFEGSEGLAWETDSHVGWYYKNEEVELKDLGLAISPYASPRTGDTITQRQNGYIKTSQYLMPYKYRVSSGDKRFYNATSEECGGWEFNNPYMEGHPKEHIFTAEDIKPTIKETMVNGLRIDMFSEFAYDLDDNDETYEDEEGNVYFKHPYFYGKLRVMDFNLFDHAIENQPMTISFTSGNCGACNFEIGVTEEYPQKNPVQVDEYGNLKRQNGRVVAGIEGTEQVVATYQDRQQDTSKYEVWIALKKEEETYGILMPQVAHRPKAAGSGNKGDTFVILGINLPESYIINAEKKLEAEIIKYLKENNDEKFTFSINFSRIYFEENNILDQLSENSKIKVAYGVDENDLDEDGNPKERIYDLYVSSFSYNMSEGDVLPEIRVELDDTLKVSQNALQNAISQVKSELGKVIGSIDVVGIATPYFIRKDADDEANGTVNFKKGIKFGEGGKVEVFDNNSAKLTIEYLEVTKKASFTSLEIQEKTHVGGQILVTPAAITCGEVEELDDAYRCYFQTKGTDGDEIFNQFMVGDQAICQTYNAWGIRYYWRLVTGIGEDYVDLSKTECDEESDIPSAGDKIIQLGNQVDEARQNAIVIAAYGDGSPYIIQYKGINAFELPADKVVTKLSSTENIFTGKVHMEVGSDGLENIEGGLKVGGSNMLRNSGFTGDYLSAQLADQIVLDAVDEMFNPPLVHWDDEDNPAVGAVVQESEVSESGKEVVLTDGHITQKLYQKVIVGETYVVSFKAKGEILSEETDEETGELVKKYTSLNITFGGVDAEIVLTDEWSYYTQKVVAEVTSDIFTIGSTNATICELQLERGSIATAWGRSFLDNSSDRAYYQARKYLDEALKGFTDVYGGLILTGLIKVGTQANGVMTKETAGMNGQYENDNDVAFWAGGSDTQAINAINQTGEDEANFAVSHGGKVVMNDAVVRGEVNASKGSFGDLKIGKYVNACGREDAESSVYSESKHSVGDENYSTVVKFSSGSISSVGSKYNSLYCTKGNELVIDSDFDLSKNLYKALIYLYGNNIAALRIGGGDIVHESGMYRGLRLPTKVITTSYNISYEEDCVIIADTGNGSLILSILAAADYEDGSFIEIHNVGNGAVVLESDLACISYNGVIATRHTIDNTHKSVKLICSRTTNLWYVTW